MVTYPECTLLLSGSWDTLRTPRDSVNSQNRKWMDRSSLFSFSSLDLLKDSFKLDWN